MKIIRTGILFLGLASLLLSACATGASVSATPAGQPNFRSIYYYTLGSYCQTEGDNTTADILLRRAADEDPRSRTISKQILLNSLELWQYGHLSPTSLRGEILGFQSKFGLDEELLYATCDFFEEDSDPDAAQKAITELQQRYPSARADIRLFIHGLRTTGQANLEPLYAAQIKADNDPATLMLLASIWYYYDQTKEKEVLLRSHELAPNEESFAALADLIIRQGNLDMAREYFSVLKYPEDRDRMYYLTQSSLVALENPVLIHLSEELLATGDIDLYNSLAYSALLGKRPDILKRISAYVDTLSAPAEDKQTLYAMLSANSILQKDDSPLPDWIGKLTDSEYFDALLTYYISGVNSRPLDSWEVQDSTAYPDFISQMRKRLPDAPSSRYLISLVTAIQDSTYTALNDDKYALILQLRERHQLSEDDYSFLMGYYQVNKLHDLYDQTLREAVKFYPDNSTYCNDLGYRLLLDKTEMETAARLIRHALVFEPDNVYFLDSLAWYHYLIGEYENALKLTALPQEETELPAEIAWHIGAIYLALEDYPAARQWLERCLNIGNDPDSTTEAEKALKRIP